ncbi:MAG: SH3 domain-containing protein [Candidatus Electrothrix sp. ATG1]|nr:SH3 domain-containing protein [Candidatus Electrothrix sp. ATG1]
MLPGKYLSFFIVFLIVSAFSSNAYCYNSIAEIRTIGNKYIGVSKNPNIDSPIIGWIPEGEFVTIISENITETVNDRQENWSQIEYKDKPGFIRTNLLVFFRKINDDEGKKGDIAKIRTNGNQSVYIRENSNIDSLVAGCIPEGEFVKIMSNPIQGNIGKIPGNWYQVNYKEHKGFIWHGLLDIYRSDEVTGVAELHPHELLLKKYHTFVKAAETINSDNNLRKEIENGDVTFLSFIKSGICSKRERGDQVKKMTCSEFKNLFNRDIGSVSNHTVANGINSILEKEDTNTRLIVSPEDLDSNEVNIAIGDLLLVEAKKKILRDDIRIFCDEPNNIIRLIKIDEVDADKGIIYLIFNDEHKASLDLLDTMFLPKVIGSYSKREFTASEN